MALVRDPDFWRRFSRAIRLDEEAKGPSESAETVVYSYDISLCPAFFELCSRPVG